MIALSPEPRPSIWLPPEYRSSFGVDPDTGAAVFGGGTVRNPAGVKITPETALRASVYLACVRVLCETMASLPLYLYRLTPNGKQKAKDHPYYKLFLRRPNGWQTAWEWKQLMMLHLCTYGEAFNEKVLSSSSESLVTELVPLAPSRIKDVVETEAGSLRYTFRTDTGKDVPYGQDQVNHFRWLTGDGIRGLVPTELAEDAIGLARACEIHGAAFFGNGARPGLVLKTPHETIDQATRDEIRFTWMREHGGPRKAHRPAVLTGGLEPAIVDGNNQESQFLETRRFQAEECCRILGVPPHMVGILDRATFSNIEQQGIGYYQQTVLGWAERIEAALTRDVLGEDMADEYELAFDVSRILRGDAAARMTYYHTGLTDGIFSVNEVREQEGMNSVEGGDQRFVGLNMQTLQQAAAASAASVLPPAETAPPAGEPDAAPAANEPAQVADVSLNGAQINGLIAILQQVTAGVIAKEGAAAIISAAFPSISRPQIDAILAGVVEASSPQAAPPAQPPQASGDARAPAGSPGDGRQRRDCGTGAGGFKPGNKCAGGGGSGGGAFASAPRTAKGAPAWRKQAKAEYEKNPEFRAAVDAATMFTQGEYGKIREVILHEKGHLDATPSGDPDGPLSSLANPLADYKNFIEGQDVAKAQTPIREAAMALDKAVSNAPPTEQPIFRGLTMPHPQSPQGQELGEWLASVEPGAVLEMHAPTSFSGSATTAEKFATGTATGQGKNRNASNGVVIEVESGARGLPVSALSPWKGQEEFLSSGEFEVISIEGDRPRSYKSQSFDFEKNEPKEVKAWGWLDQNGGVRMRIRVRQRKKQ